MIDILFIITADLGYVSLSAHVQTFISLSSPVLRGHGGDTLCAGYPSDHHNCSRVSFAVCACANLCQPEQHSVEGIGGHLM